MNNIVILVQGNIRRPVDLNRYSRNGSGVWENFVYFEKMFQGMINY